MSKSVLISIQPYYVFLIIAKTMGWDIPQEKTIEVRKTVPKDKDWNKKVIIYCSKSKKSFAKIPKEYQSLMGRLSGKVIGEFVCDAIISHCEMANADIAEQQGCIKREWLLEYAGDKELYGWHISDLVIYDKLRELSKFYTLCYSDCNDCKYQSWDYEYGGGKCSICTVRNKKPITRPPQNYCYVEGLANH